MTARKIDPGFSAFDLFKNNRIPAGCWDCKRDTVVIGMDANQKNYWLTTILENMNYQEQQQLVRQRADTTYVVIVPTLVFVNAVIEYIKDLKVKNGNLGLIDNYHGIAVFITRYPGIRKTSTIVIGKLNRIRAFLSSENVNPFSIVSVIMMLDSEAQSYTSEVGFQDILAHTFHFFKTRLAVQPKYLIEATKLNAASMKVVVNNIKKKWHFCAIFPQSNFGSKAATNLSLFIQLQNCDQSEDQVVVLGSKEAEMDRLSKEWRVIGENSGLYPNHNEGVNQAQTGDVTRNHNCNIKFLPIESFGEIDIYKTTKYLNYDCVGLNPCLFVLDGTDKILQQVGKFTLFHSSHPGLGGKAN